MSEPKGFFGNIFESSEEDPLLQSDPISEGDSAPHTSNNASGSAARSASNGSGADGLFSGSPDHAERTHQPQPSRTDRRAPARARETRDDPASWTSSGSDDSPEEDETKRIAITEAHDPWADCTTWEGLDALNDALQTGWHVVDIEKSHASSDTSNLELTLVLERDIPRSLFDFGPSW